MSRSSNHSDDEENGENDDNEEVEYEVYIDSLNKKGEMIFHALGKNKNAYSNFFEIMTCAIESTKLIRSMRTKLIKWELLSVSMPMILVFSRKPLKRNKPQRNLLRRLFSRIILSERNP